MNSGLHIATEDGSPHRPTRVLIADDTPSNRELLRSILESSGYEVAEVEDGSQVVARAIAFQPDLVILDLQMPKLDGYAVTTALRKTAGFESTPIVALTAALREAAPEEIARAGFNRYLVKPIGPARMRQCVASLLCPPAA